MNSADDFFALSKTPKSQMRIDSQNGALISLPVSERQQMLNEKIKQFVRSFRKDREGSGGFQNNKNKLRLNSDNESMNNGGITSQHYLVSPSHSSIMKKDSDPYGQTLMRGKSHHTINNLPSNETKQESAKNEQKPSASNMFKLSGTMGVSEKSSVFPFSLSNSKMTTFDKTIGNKTPKIKGLHQILPMISTLRSSVNSQVNNLESNLTKLAKFVKIKKKVGEMKRNVLRNGIIKHMLSKTGNPFNKVLDDSVSNLPTDKTDFGVCWSLGGFLYSIFCLNTVLSLLKKIPTIEPSSKFKLIWDVIVGAAFMIFFFFIPVHIAINEPIQDLVTAQLGYVLNCIMGVDIIFSMMTGYFEKGVNTSDKSKILLFYIKNYFWSDIISQIPLLVSELGSTDSQYEKIFVVCFFVKIRNFQKIFRKFEESFHLSPRVSNIISLIKLLLIILFFSHIFACLWIFVGNNQDEGSSTWLKKINLQDEDWKQQYIAAYYFSTVTMITVGYGDINPMNNLERMVSVGTMLVSCIIFAYTINQIGTIFSDLFSQDRQLKEFFYIINEYMDNKNIGFSLQYKIRQYLDFYWREQDQNKSELEKKIIDSLSDQLRENLMIEANRIVLKDSGIFHHNFNSAVILKMIPLIQMIHTTPNQIIFQEGQIDDDMAIYFVEKGTIEICRDFISDNGAKVTKSITTLGKGSCFGSYSFLTNQERKETARSSEFSKLLMIRRSDFLELIQENPQDVERFCFLKDSILMEKNLEYLEIRCKACLSYNHEIQHCHFFHYSPDKYVVIKRHNLRFQKQNRDEIYTRKSRFVQLKPLHNVIDIKSSTLHWKEQQQTTIIEQYKQQYLQHEHHNSKGAEYQDPYYFNGQYEEGSEEYDEDMGEDFYEEEEENQEYDDEEEEQYDENNENSGNNNDQKLRHSSSTSSNHSKQSASSSTKQRRTNKFKQNIDSDEIKEEVDREGEITTSHMKIANKLSQKANKSFRFKSKSAAVSEDDSYQQKQQVDDQLKFNDMEETHSIRMNNPNISISSDDQQKKGSSSDHHSSSFCDKTNEEHIITSINDEFTNLKKADKQNKMKRKIRPKGSNSLNRQSESLNVKSSSSNSQHPINKTTQKLQKGQDNQLPAENEQNNPLNVKQEELPLHKLTLKIPSKIMDSHQVEKSKISQEQQYYSPELITFNAKENSNEELDYQPGFIESPRQDQQFQFQYECLQYFDDFNSPDQRQLSQVQKSINEVDITKEKQTIQMPIQQIPSTPDALLLVLPAEQDRKQEQQKKQSSGLSNKPKKIQTGLLNQVNQENIHRRNYKMATNLSPICMDEEQSRSDNLAFQTSTRKIRTLTQLPFDKKKKKRVSDPELKIQYDQGQGADMFSRPSKSHPMLRSSSRAKSFQNDDFKRIKHNQQENQDFFTTKNHEQEQSSQQNSQKRQHQTRLAKTEQTTTQQILQKKNSSESFQSSSSQAGKNSQISSGVVESVQINSGPSSTQRKSNFASSNSRELNSKNLVQKHSSIPSNLLLRVPGGLQMSVSTNEKQFKNRITGNAMNTSVNQANRSDSNNSVNNANKMELSPSSTVSLKQNFLKRNVLSIEEPMSELRKYTLNQKDSLGKRNSFSIQSTANHKMSTGLIGRRSFAKQGSSAAVDQYNSQRPSIDNIIYKGNSLQQQLFSGHKMQIKPPFPAIQSSSFADKSPKGLEGQIVLNSPQVLLFNNNNNNTTNSNNNTNHKTTILQQTTPSQIQIPQPSLSTNNQPYNQNAINTNGLIIDETDDEPDSNLFLIMNFDELKNYPFYFPKSNSTKVIHKANLIINNNFVKIIKRKKNKFEDIINASRRPSAILKKLTLQKRQTIHPAQQVVSSLKNISPPI